MQHVKTERKLLRVTILVLDVVALNSFAFACSPSLVTSFRPSFFLLSLSFSLSLSLSLSLCLPTSSLAHGFCSVVSCGSDLLPCVLLVSDACSSDVALHSDGVHGSCLLSRVAALRYVMVLDQNPNFLLSSLVSRLSSSSFSSLSSFRFSSLSLFSVFFFLLSSFFFLSLRI